MADLNSSVYSVDLESVHREIFLEDAGIVTGIVYCEARLGVSDSQRLTARL